MASASDPLVPPAPVSEQEVDRLFSLPLDRFVSSRDELAKRLRGEDREASAWVKGLRRPSRAAWVTNQLVRRNRKETRRLLEAAEALGAAQRELAQGAGDAGELRRRTAQERHAVSDLVDQAGRLTDDVSEAVLDQIRDTLHAVALDEEARRRVEKGRLTKELQASGFGSLLAPPADAGERASPKQEQAGPAGARRRRDAERRLDAARRKAEESERLLAEARRTLSQAGHERDRAQKRFEEAANRERRAGRAVDKAQARVREAERRLRAVDER